MFESDSSKLFLIWTNLVFEIVLAVCLEVGFLRFFGKARVMIWCRIIAVIVVVVDDLRSLG